MGLTGRKRGWSNRAFLERKLRKETRRRSFRSIWAFGRGTIWHFMPERGEFELPEPEEIIQRVADTLGLDPQKSPDGLKAYPDERIYPEEAPTADGRYIARSCLKEICRITLDHASPDQQLLLSPGDVRWLYREFRQIVEEAWEWVLPEPFPDFTLGHLVGAAKRQIAELQELARFEETLRYRGPIAFLGYVYGVIEQAVIEDQRREHTV